MNYLKMNVFVSVFILTSISILSGGYADGMAFKLYDDDSGWSLMDEETQTAFINHEDGTEKMIISIKIGNESASNAVWLFPIPSDPDDIRIDALNTFPVLNGYDFIESSRDDIKDALLTISATQIYMIPVALIPKSTWGVALIEDGIYGQSLDGNAEDKGITIHQHEEEMGLTSEVITVRDTQAFYDYLEGNNLSLPENARSQIEEYSGKKYSFVVSWIADIEEFKNYATDYQYESAKREYDYFFQYELNELEESSKYKPKLEYAKEFGPEEDVKKYQELFDEDREEMIYYASTHAAAMISSMYGIDMEKPVYHLGVNVEFPTESIYFPLKPTSIYGDAKIPVDVFVMGFTEPEIYESIIDDTKVTYKLHPGYLIPEQFQGFFGNEGRIDLKYTKISINTNSNNFEDDLYIKDSVPSKLELLSFVEDNITLLGICLLLIISAVSGIVAAKVAYKDSNAHPMRKSGLFGLLNVFSLAGLSSFAYFFGMDENLKNEDYKSRRPSFIKKTIIASIICMLILTFSRTINEFMDPLYNDAAILFLPIVIFFGILKMPQSLIIEELFSVYKLSTMNHYIAAMAINLAVCILVFYSFFASRNVKTRIPRYLAVFTVVFMIQILAIYSIIGMII